jgi:LemA protein
MTELLIALAVLALLAIFLVGQYNKLIRLNVAVDESFAQIGDVMAHEGYITRQ